ncbi:tyrosinase family oxidase copper chaperone [Streptomyces sp. CSDS2]|uniref:tyrosinase family oxidase copper chaperone n=1 Tax=Streptomyces sp. CSDS2 TaxID=3055051 RepID=UPI0025B0B8B0|nr:tyrosinase family oxidase copper chaperone [Streptomyces sp. CSDS2]MDN3264767.1 tyrosinase family oxidase copper chaperone [Streptomyces sp. CSDS2]
MVVGIGEVRAGAQQQAGTGAARPSRREMTRGLLAVTAALALTPVVAASRAVPSTGEPGGGSFDEIYRGRRIRGVRMPAVGRGAVGGEWRITVDGRPLHLMRRADGTWLSMVDHYTSYGTPLEATRAAVDEVGPGRRLRVPAPERSGGDFSGAHPGGHAHTGDRHGVRA